MSARRFEAICFDLGNVFVPFDWGRAARALSALHGFEPRRLQAELTGPLQEQVGSGRLHPDAWLQGLNARSGRNIPLEAMRAAWCDLFTFDLEVVGIAEALATRLPLHLWSNTDPLHFAHLRPQLPVLERFRTLQLSCAMGCTKPGPAYFERAIDAGGFAPGRALFIDDRAENLVVPRALGMATVLHRDAATTRSALVELGLLERSR